MPWVAFLSFALLNHWTPGPNNIMAMTSGVRVGFRKSIPFLLGMLAGVTTVSALIMVGTSVVVTLAPIMTLPLKILGAVYMLWLAYKTIHTNYDYDPETVVAATFLQGVALQAVNAKMILFLLTVYSQFILPYYSNPLALASFVVGISLSAWIAHLGWTAFGSLFEVFLHKYTVWVNGLLALLIVYAAVSLFL